MAECRTLWAVDELIRFATNGARSIRTVTVLDAFPFKPEKESNIPDERCHQLLADIIKAKKAKVIIRSHGDDYQYTDLWMKQFQLPPQNNPYNFVRKEVQLDENHTTVVLQSFHPSTAVNYAAYKLQYRASWFTTSSLHLPNYVEQLSFIKMLKVSANCALGQGTVHLVSLRTAALFADLVLLARRVIEKLSRSWKRQFISQKHWQE